MQFQAVVPHGLPVSAVIDAVLHGGANNAFVLAVGPHEMVHTVTHCLSQGEFFDALLGEIGVQVLL